MYLVIITRAVCAGVRYALLLVSYSSHVLVVSCVYTARWPCELARLTATARWPCELARLTATLALSLAV